MRPSNSEMKQETNVIAIVTYLNYVAWNGVLMASSRKCLLEDEIEQSLLQELTASDQSSCSDDDDSSGTDDLTVVS